MLIVYLGLLKGHTGHVKGCLTVFTLYLRPLKISGLKENKQKNSTTLLPQTKMEVAMSFVADMVPSTTSVDYSYQPSYPGGHYTHRVVVKVSTLYQQVPVHFCVFLGWKLET